MTPTMPQAHGPPTLYTVSELEQHYGRGAVVRVVVDDPDLVEAELASLAPPRKRSWWILLVMVVVAGGALFSGYAFAHRSAARAIAAACAVPPPAQVAAAPAAAHDGSPAQATPPAAQAAMAASANTQEPTARRDEPAPAASAATPPPVRHVARATPRYRWTPAPDNASARERAATEAALKRDLEALRQRAAESTAGNASAIAPATPAPSAIPPSADDDPYAAPDKPDKPDNPYSDIPSGL